MKESLRIFVDPVAGSCWFFRPGPARDLASTYGITFANAPNQADIVVSDRMKRLRTIGLKFPWRKYLLWTQEPRYDVNTAPAAHLFGFLKPLRIMNVYTGDVFMSNTGIWGHRIVKKIAKKDAGSAFRLKERSVVIVASYQARNTQLMIGDRDIDLCKTRQRLSLKLHRRGLSDIFGKNWPANLSKGASRHGGWTQSKDEILAPYRFNLCLENTDYQFYCTEKIWDSIRNFCIPIYTSKNNKIYDNFEGDSFIDISRFKSSDEIADYIIGLSDHDAAKRLMRCVDGYNAAYAERFERRPNTAEEVVLKFVEVVKSL